MRVIESLAAMRHHSDTCRKKGLRIGFVPTMGALHEGHLHLIRRACEVSDVAIVSVFVNPTQFTPQEDLERYPRPFDRDCVLASEAGAAIVFHPSVPDMYPEGSSVRVDPGIIADTFEGAIRPGHFAGVATVVLKFFNIVAPDIAVFGQKDAQQAILIRRLIRDLNVPVELLIEPTVREADGMAMSSRNVYLSQSERIAARSISAALFEARDRFLNGERDAAQLREGIVERIAASEVLQLDYAAVVSADSFMQIDGTIDVPTVNAIVAVRAGNTRLIDNIVLDNTGAHA